MTQELPSIEELRQLINYDENTGLLTWLERGREWFSRDRDMLVWNKRFAGKPAINTPSSYGFLEGRVLSCHVYAHQIAYAMSNGAYPKGDVKHMNGDKKDNRKNNLIDTDTIAGSGCFRFSTYRDDPSKLWQILDYNPETGKFYWRKRPSSMFKTYSAYNSWSKRYSGKEAFTSVSNTDGYKRGSIANKSVLAHRVAWAMMTGGWPKTLLDHINGVRSDNRFSNLRCVTPEQNSRNSKRRSNNKTGVTGVYQEKRTGIYVARIEVGDGQVKTLCRTRDLEEAKKARKEAEKTHGYHRNHGREG